MLGTPEGMTIEERRSSFVTFLKNPLNHPNVVVINNKFESLVGLPYLEISLESSNQADFKRSFKAILAKGKELAAEVNTIDTTPVIFITGTDETLKGVLGMFKTHKVEFEQDSIEFEYSRKVFKVKFTLTFR